MTTIDHRLSPLKKSDLQFTYPPSTSGGDDPSKRGIPDSKLLNRSEWYEMLYFCNKFANENANATNRHAVALKAERLIKRQVPSNLHSHANIEDWLKRNWELYPNA